MQDHPESDGRAPALEAPLRPWAIALLATVAAVSPWTLGTLGTWISAACVCFLLWEGTVAPALRARLRRGLPWLLVIGTFVTVCGPLLAGHPPASRDHGVHYLQTHIFIHDLVREGTLRGWTDRINHGIPMGDAYPMLGYMLAGALHLLSGFTVPLRASYALFMAALWAGSMLATAGLAAAMARSLAPEPSVRDEATRRTSIRVVWVGVVAALAWGLDPGSSREGGWNYLMFHGVWPQQLSVMLWCVGLRQAILLRDASSRRRVCGAALAFGGSMLAHPFGLLACALVPVALVLAHLMCPVREDPSSSEATSDEANARTLARWLLVAGGAALVAAGSTHVLLASADSMGRGPVPWKELPVLAARFWSGELFQAQHAAVGACAVIGVLLTLRARTFSGLALAVICAGVFLAGSRDALTTLRLDLLVPSLKNVQFIRWSIFLKPIWYAFAGVGAVAVAEVIGDRRARAPAPRRARLVGSLVLGPMLAAGISGVGTLVTRPVGGLHILAGTPYEARDEALADALSRARGSLDGRRPRVAFLRGGMSGGTYPLFALADADAAVVLDGHVPAINFHRRVRARDPGLLRSLGVTHVLFDRPLPGEDDALASSLRDVEHIGPYTFGRLDAADGQPVGHNATFEMVAPGRVEITSQGRGDRLRVPIAPYRKWRAYDADGAEIPAEAARFRRGLTGTELVMRAGQTAVTLRYENPRDEVQLAWLSRIAALALLLGMCLPSWRGGALSTLVTRLTSRRPRMRSLPSAARTGIFVVGAVAATLLVLDRQRTQLARTWRAAAPSWDDVESAEPPPAVRDLVTDRGIEVRSEDFAACDGMKTRDAQARCVPADAAPHLSTLFAAPYLYRCLRVEIPAEGTTELRLDTPAPSQTLELIFDRIPRAGGGRGRITRRLQAAGETEFVKVRDRSRVTLPGAQLTNPEVILELSNPDRTPARVCVAAAHVDAPPSASTSSP